MSHVYFLLTCYRQASDLMMRSKMEHAWLETAYSISSGNSLTALAFHFLAVRIRNDEQIRLVRQGGILTICLWSDRLRLVYQYRKVDGGISSRNVLAHTPKRYRLFGSKPC